MRARPLRLPPQHLIQVARVVEVRQVVGHRQRLGALQQQRAVQGHRRRLELHFHRPASGPADSRGSRAEAVSIERDKRADTAAAARSAETPAPAPIASCAARASPAQVGRHELFAVRHHPRRDRVRRRDPCRARGRDPRASTDDRTDPTRRPPTTAPESTLRARSSSAPAIFGEPSSVVLMADSAHDLDQHVRRARRWLRSAR